MKFENYGENIQLHDVHFSLSLRVFFLKDEEWRLSNLKAAGDRTFQAKEEGICLALTFDEAAGCGLPYHLEFTSDFETRIKLELELLDEKELFHLIPANIFGDNNIAMAKPNEYPILTDGYPEEAFCSTVWEFRADRASHPVSILCCAKGAVGISIDPYSPMPGEEHVRNGVFAQLPNQFGVTLGYCNTPFTFITKRQINKATYDLSKSALASGKIYSSYGKGRQEAHKILRHVYYAYHETPEFKKTYGEAAKSLIDAFINISWSDLVKNYTNLNCTVPDDNHLKPWRQLPEIGWTAGGVMAYPFAVGEYVLGIDRSYFRDRKSYRELLDEIAACYNEKSGLLNDVTIPNWRVGFEPSNVNGWWADFGLVKDCHCAYTVGSALAYMMRTLRFLKQYKNESNENWLDISLKVLDTMVELQGENGSYGYTYSAIEKKVLDWEGFAGCWFAESMAYGYEFTHDEKYVASAKKALEYYYGFVKGICCWGTPMDTWKSVDEEGNLAFIRAARLLHEITGEKRYLKMLEAGANYEYIWKYAYRVQQDLPPLKDSNWNSCGGSVTSVSNPHIHPMGMLVLKDLEYLAEQTHDAYHKDRARDTIAFMMNTMELYPEVTGYGRYGVLTERFCASDGLIIEHFSDGTPSSSWFSYNGWAGAAALEGIVEELLRRKTPL
jgi:hypothetical protein